MQTDKDIYFASIGAGIEQKYGIKTVKDMGYKVIAFDIKNDACGKVDADVFYNIDIKDKEKICEILKEYNIKGVIPSPIGKFITTVGYINDKFSLKGPSERVCHICSNKNLLNDFLKNNAFHCPEEYNIYDIDNINFPVILKPEYGSGSKNVKVVYDKNELLEYINNYNNSFYGNLVINEFIEGKEYGLDITVINGKIEFLNIRDKFITEIPYRQELSYICPADISGNESENIHSTVSRFVTLIGIKDALMNADIIVSNRKSWGGECIYYRYCTACCWH